MSRLDLSRGNKSLWQRVEALWRSMLPRQARVTRTEGNSVWVKFLGDSATDPESKFPSTVAGVPTATMGWVITLGGKKGMFVATGIPVDTRFGRASGSPAGENTTLVTSTFSQAKSLWLTTLADLIPATATGTWTVKMTASVVVSRSVTTGGVYLFPSINGVSRNAVPRQFPQDNAYTVARTHVVEGCTGASELEVRYSGQGTAGQTNVWDWDVDITAVRTG